MQSKLNKKKKKKKNTKKKARNKKKTCYLFIYVFINMYYLQIGVRIAAAESLPFLLDCAQIRGAEYRQSMWQPPSPSQKKIC